MSRGMPTPSVGRSENQRKRMAEMSVSSPPPLPPQEVEPVSLPKLDHLTRAHFEAIYEPADDTYLLVDTLHADGVFLEALKPSVCVEIGGGSGCVSAALSQVLRQRGWLCANVITDINADAAEACQATLEANDAAFPGVVRGSLGSCLRSEVADVLVFNPPYVPTPPEEVGGTGIAAAWAGGLRGRQVLDLLLPDLPRIVRPGGCVYLIAVEENDPKGIMRILDDLGFDSIIRSKRRAQNERLMVIRSVRRSHDVVEDDTTICARSGTDVKCGVAQVQTTDGEC